MYLRAGAAAVLCLLAAAVAAQVQQPPTFRGGVSLVTIDVTVLDDSGRPVQGLTPADLEIKLDGKAQPIRAFAFVQAAAPSAPARPAAAAAPPAATVAKPAAPAAFPAPDAPRRTIDNSSAPSAPAAPSSAPATAAKPAEPAESRLFVLVVDDLSFAPTRGKAMLSAAERFLARVPPSDPVGFTTTTGIGAVNPTRDRAAVRAALSKVMGQFNDPRGLRKSGAMGAARQGGGTDSPLGISESLDIERGDDALLKDVIARECFNGDRTAVAGVTLADLLRDNECAVEVRREARQVAGLVRQNKGRQIEGVKSVMRAMAGVAGIRHLVLLSDGLPVSREVNDLHPLVRAAAEAGVQLSVLLEDPDISLADEGRGGELAPGVKPQTDPGVSRRRREDDLLLVNGLQTMTDMLGGTFYRVVGRADPFFDRVLVASSAVYRLGVELPPGAKPGDVFDVSVSVKRPGVKARANRFSVAAAPAATAPVPAPEKPAASPSPAAAVPIDDVLKAALNENPAAGAVPIRMAAYVRRAPQSDEVEIRVDVAIPGSAKGPLTTYFGVVHPVGVLSAPRVLDAPGPAGYVTTFTTRVKAGDYRIRFAAADPGRALGTIELPVRAVLTPMGAFTASDVLTWYIDDANKPQLFALEDVPDGVSSLRASLELYGDLTREPPVVRWTLTPEGAAAAVDQQEVAAQAGPASFRADAEFNLAALPAGRYTIRAEVAGATRSAVVRKE
ncbi:MAG: VWA domain-containing protein [Vicinamibacterales bacterium]